MIRPMKMLSVCISGIFLLLQSILFAEGSPDLVSKDIEVKWNPVFGGGYRGVWNSGKGMTLVSYYPVKKSSPLIIIEAENASAVLTHDKGVIKKDKEASGGAFVFSPKTIELFLDLEKAEDYSVWYRVRFAEKLAESRHLEGMDVSLGGPVAWISLKKSQEGWHWQKGNIRHSFKRKGMQELQMAQIPDGMELDTIVLANDENWTPEKNGMELKPLEPVPWLNSSLETEDLFFAEVNAWKKVACAIDPKDGKASFQYSCDSGKTWNAVPADGNLSSTPARSDGRDKIRFKIQMSRKQGGTGPMVSPSLDLSYQTPSDSLVTVEDDLVRHYFARKNGALCGIENKKTGTQLLPVGTPSPVFHMQLKKPGLLSDDRQAAVISKEDTPDGHDVLKLAGTANNKLESVNSLDAQCLEFRVDERPGDGFYKAIYSKYVFERTDGSVNVDLTVKFKRDGESQWTMKAVNNLRGLEICEVTYPVLDRVKVAADPTKETLLLFGNYLVQKPSFWGHFQYWWPGVSYPMLDISSEKEGISLISHDKTLRSTGLSSEGQHQTTTRLELNRAVCIQAGQAYDGTENIVRVHEGTWEKACFLEKDWAQKNVQLADSPLWARELDFLATGGWPVLRWDRWSDYAVSVPPGSELFAMWNYQVPGTFWTVPHPNPMMGDEEDLRYAVKDFRKSGMRLVMYFQSLLWDEAVEGTGKPEDKIGYLQRRQLWPGWEIPTDGFAQSNCSRDIYGKQFIYSPENISGKYFNTPMDQASSGFYNYKYRWSVDLFGKKLGLDGIYWDSDSGFFGSPCWRGWQDKGFDPGISGRAAVENALRIRKAYQEMRPDAVFVGEGSPSAAMHQARDFTLQNLYSVYPMKIMFPKLKMMAEGKNYDKAFLAGICFIKYNDPSAVPMFERYTGMRRLVTQYLNAGEFYNEKGIRINGDGVEAKIFLLNDERNKGFLLNILNKKKVKDASIEVDSSEVGAINFGWIVRDDLTEGAFALPKEISPLKYKISVPEAEAMHILLLNRAEPRVIVNAGKPLTAGCQTALALKITSITDRQTGTAIVEMPERLKKLISSAVVKFDVNGGETKDYSLPVKASLDTPPDIVTIPVSVKPDGSASFLRHVSMYANEPVSVKIEMVGPETMRVTLENKVDEDSKVALGFKAVKGTVTLEKGDFKIECALKGNEKKEFPIATKGAAEAQKPWAIRGEMSYRYLVKGFEKKEDIYKKFWPLVPNGSFESYDFRKGAPDKEYYSYSKNPDKLEAFQKNLPDYWWGILSDRSPQLSTRQGISIDDQEAGDGVRSLKLVPDTSFRSLVPISLVKDRSYRIRMKMKWSAPSPRNYACFVNNSKEGGAFGMIGLKPDAAPGKWHQLEETFKAQADSATLYFYSGKGTTAWFDDISVVPVEDGWK